MSSSPKQPSEEHHCLKEFGNGLITVEVLFNSAISLESSHSTLREIHFLNEAFPLLEPHFVRFNK